MQIQNFNEPIHPLLQKKQRTDASEYALQLYALPEDLEYVNQYTPLEHLRLKNMYQPNPMRYFAPAKHGDTDIYHHVPAFEFSEILEFQQNNTAAITETTIKALGLLTQSRITYKQQLDKLQRMQLKPKSTEPRPRQQDFPTYEDASKRLLAETSNDLHQPRLKQISQEPTVQQAVVPGQAPAKSTIKTFNDDDAVTMGRAADLMMQLFKQQTEEYKAAQKQSEFMYQQQQTPYYNGQQQQQYQNRQIQQYQQQQNNDKQPQIQTQDHHNLLIQQLADRFKQDQLQQNQQQQQFDPKQPIVPGIYLTTQPHRPPTHQQDISAMNNNTNLQAISYPPNYLSQPQQTVPAPQQPQQAPIYSSNVYNTVQQPTLQQNYTQSIQIPVQQASQQPNYDPRMYSQPQQPLKTNQQFISKDNNSQQTIQNQQQYQPQIQQLPQQNQQFQQVSQNNQLVATEPDVEIDLNDDIPVEAQFEPIQVELDESEVRAPVQPVTPTKRPESANVKKQQSQQPLQAYQKINQKHENKPIQQRVSDPTLSSAVSMISSGVAAQQTNQHLQNQKKQPGNTKLNFQQASFSDGESVNLNANQPKKTVPVPELVQTDSGSAEFAVGQPIKKPQEMKEDNKNPKYNQQKPPINVAAPPRDQTIQDILRQLSDEEDEDDSFDINKDSTKKPSPARKKQKKKIATNMQKSIASEISESFLTQIGKKPPKTKQSALLEVTDNDLFSD